MWCFSWCHVLPWVSHRLAWSAQAQTSHFVSKTIVISNVSVTSNIKQQEATNNMNSIMFINVRLSRSVTYTAHHISRAPQAVLIVLSRWRMDKGARDPAKPPKGTHVKDCTDWLPNFVGSSWQCLFVETRTNSIICCIYTLRHYGPRKSNWTTKMVRIRQTIFGPLHICTRESLDRAVPVLLFSQLPWMLRCMYTSRLGVLQYGPIKAPVCQTCGWNIRSLQKSCSHWIHPMGCFCF